MRFAHGEAAVMFGSRATKFALCDALVLIVVLHSEVDRSLGAFIELALHVFVFSRSVVLKVACNSLEL